MPSRSNTSKPIKKPRKPRSRPSLNQTLQLEKLSSPSSELTHIQVRGAGEHNLKQVDIDLPKKALIVLTGVSGSGKSSLAFDTLFAEGQRRYVESLSAYARQFLGQMEKPKFETIRGLSPTISIEQKAASKNPRSTVGTITEVYDYLRVLFARIGNQTCHICGSDVGRGDASSMVKQIMTEPTGTKCLLLAPIVENRKGEHRDKFEELKADGYQRVRIDGVVQNLADVQSLAKNKKHNIEVVVDRLVIKEDKSFRSRLTDSVENALKLGQGRLILHILDREDKLMSEERSCCGHAFPQLDPPLFSFNSPLGMCPSCHGLGVVPSMDEHKIIPDPSLSIREGAILPWRNYFLGGEKEDSWAGERFRAMEKQWKLDFDTPWRKLSKAQQKLVLYGSKTKSLKLKWKGEKSEGVWDSGFEGLLPQLMRRYQQTTSDSMKAYYQQYMSTRACTACDGQRLKPEVLAVKVGGLSIIDVTELNIAEALRFFENLKLTEQQSIIASELRKEIVNRLAFLVNVGLSYLSMSRKGPTLSGGEAQRIRLASQIGAELTGVLYVLDEPSIGLHQRDNKKLIQTLMRLRDIGNTLVVVEHDQETIEEADWVVDIGPGAGHLGGQVVAAGTPGELKTHPASLTGQYLSGRRRIVRKDKLPVDEEGAYVSLYGARENNLQDVDLHIPLGRLVCVSGVSGAGKSTLINQILYPALARELQQSDQEAGHYESLEGADQLDKVINIDQKPIGRTPRSNPATYTKAFDLIRDFFADLPESKLRGYTKGRFSFNVKGGRCEACKGDGSVKVEMHFLADVYVPCEACGGKRFNEATLEVKYRGHSIADVLELSVAQALELFKNHPKIRRILETLDKVGLSYIKLGQAATTLSGGEAQRVKLSRELARKDTGSTLYILDEPTTGLHFQDIQNLLNILDHLVKLGNTVVVIEHNLDMIAQADWVIDIGPEGGHAGGSIVVEGSVEEICKPKYKTSHTGQCLREHLA